jgi:hypothetical protein
VTPDLEALYPGLRRQPAASRDELLTSVRAKVDDSIAARRASLETQSDLRVDMVEAAARRIGMTTLALSGGDGGRLKAHPAVDVCLVAEQSSVHRVQECNLVAYHVLWDLVHTRMAQDRDGSDKS